MENIINWVGGNPWALIPVLVWVLYWKGLALWKSARLGEKWWFIALLVVNTLGILEIIYIYVFAGKKESNKTSELNS